MALVLIEEVLMGLEEAKEALEQAVMTLANVTEDAAVVSLMSINRPLVTALRPPS